MVHVEIMRSSEYTDLPIPCYATEGSAGMDLYAALPQGETLTLSSGERHAVSTGISIALPDGYEAQIRPRSGLALRYGIGMVNSPGTVDSDYRGVIKVILINLGKDNYTIHRGDRIAQLVVAPVTRIEWVETNELLETERGQGGFGSTGYKVAIAD